MIKRLIYASKSTRPLEDKDIEQILEASRRNNLVDGVTGMLCHGNSRFLQFLEGDSEAVNRIYSRIQQDSRHDELILIEKRQDEKRLFGDWSMGFIDVNDLWTQVAMKETTKMNGFFPEKLNPSMALRLVSNLKSSLSDQIII